MSKIEYTICNNSVDIIELMWIEEPKAVSIFIHTDGSITVCADNGTILPILKEFEKGTNLLDVQWWIDDYIGI